MKLDSTPAHDERLDDLLALTSVYGDDLLRADVAFIVEQATTETAAVAVLGQFKRGKSTLLNALLAEDVLPTGRLPLTGVTTRVVFGERGLTVHFLDGRIKRTDLADIAAYVTEDRNPANRLGVAHVDAALPVPLLRGAVFIDTPGIGSTLTHNTRTAREASERVDLAIFVTGPEPPITNEELSFLREVRNLAERIVVVVAKIDLVHGDEAEVLDFTRRTVEGAFEGAVPIFCADAVHADERVDALREFIARNVAESGGALARRSRARRVRRATLRIRRGLELRRAAAMLPSSERKRARALFADLAGEIDERGADLVRAIEQFPTEELVSVDVLLDTLVERGISVVSAEIDSFVTQGPGRGEHALHARVAECEAEWSARVSSALDRRIEKRRTSTLHVLSDLERRFAEAGSKALGLQIPQDDDAERIEFGAREAATRMSGPSPTTGLEIVTGGLLAALPAPLRSRALRKRFGTLTNQLLDRSRGRVRSAAVRYLLEWRIANVGLIRERLLAARRFVEDAFDGVSGIGDDADLHAVMERMERDERTLDAVVAAFP